MIFFCCKHNKLNLMSKLPFCWWGREGEKDKENQKLSGCDHGYRLKGDCCMATTTDWWQNLDGKTSSSSSTSWGCPLRCSMNWSTELALVQSRMVRLSISHSALEALCDYALYKSTFTLHYITLRQQHGCQRQYGFWMCCLLSATFSLRCNSCNSCLVPFHRHLVDDQLHRLRIPGAGHTRVGEVILGAWQQRSESVARSYWSQ